MVMKIKLMSHISNPHTEAVQHHHHVSIHVVRNVCGIVLRGAPDWNGARGNIKRKLAQLVKEAEANAVGLDREIQEPSIHEGIENKRPRVQGGSPESEDAPSSPSMPSLFLSEESTSEANAAEIDTN